MSMMSSGSQFFNRSATNTGFADPFNDIATTQMPTTMKSALWWSEYIWTVQGTYRMAMERIVSYFITDIEIGGDVSDDEKTKYSDFLNKQLNVLAFLGQLMRDRLCYGNSFASVVVPFRRFLRNPKTGDIYPLKYVYDNFDFKFTEDFKFEATCPKTKWRGAWIVEDKAREESKHVILKRWSPHEIEILHDPYTDEVAYLWRIPEYYKKMVKDGNLFHLERASKQVLEAIRTDKLFRFNPDAVFHMKEPTLAGIRNLGWGLPRSLTNYRQIWYVQVLRRYNEAIALDYVIPFRLITPAARSGGSNAGSVATQDPMSIYSAGDFRSQVRQMINRRRRDPAAWQLLPFPVNYQILGGDAKQLAPTELIQQGTEELLNECGTPVEFYQGSLSLQAAPVALRLFESTHRQLVTDANTFLQWMVTALSQIMSWETVECSLQRVTTADDMQKQMAALQLMMGQQLSGTTGLRAMGYSWDSEQKLLAEEASKQQKMQARQAEEAEQAGFAGQVAKGVNPEAGAGAPPPGGGGAPPPGGAPPAGGGGPAPAGAGGALGGGVPTPVTTYLQSMGPNAAITPNDLQSTAEQLAQELLGIPESIKDSELRKLKQNNATLHSVTRTKLDEARQKMKTQGGAMLQQQLQQGGGGGG
jgi:hypothetical protein